MDTKLKAQAQEALKGAIEKAGNAAVLARHLGITKGAISQWSVCPPGRVVQVEGITGVSRHDLRPDIFGKSPPSAAG